MSKFKVKKVTEIKDESTVESVMALELPTSDLCLTAGNKIIQFEYMDEDQSPIEKVPVKPGIYSMKKTVSGIGLAPTELRNQPLLTSVMNTRAIKQQVYAFFNKIEVYKRLKQPLKRSILLYSAPGLGKSSAIGQTCSELREEDTGTVVLLWPSSELKAEDVSNFLSFAADYTPEVTRLLLILEDIGGMQEEGNHRHVSAGMLNMLDGMGVTFTVPTFIIATTNFPESLMETLNDRPGRFDELIELLPPKGDERVAILEFIENRTLTDSEKSALMNKRADSLSIAHLKEIAIRAALFDKTFDEVIDQMLNHKKRIKKNFSKQESMGIGFSND